MQKDKIHSTNKKNKEACCGKDKSTKRQEKTTEEPRMPLSVKMIERNNKKKTPKAALHKLPGKSSLNFSFVFPVCPVCPAHDHHGRHDRHNHHDIINHHTRPIYH